VVVIANHASPFGQETRSKGPVQHLLEEPMKKAILFAAALATLVAGTAMAAPGVNLSWDDCQASLALGLNKTSTCLSNVEASKRAYGTYVLPAPGTVQTAGNDIVLDIMTNSATLPCWWNFTVAPRTTGFQMQFNTVCADAGGVGIFDYWSSIAGGPVGGSGAFLMPTNAVPRVRIKGVVAVDAGAAEPLGPDIETYSFTLVLVHGSTVGACTGCLTPACFVLNLIQVTQVNDPPYILTNPSSRQHVFWQGGVVQAPGCPAAVPTQNKTWGSVKALYR
jgi:hypothetical protein